VRRKHEVKGMTRSHWLAFARFHTLLMVRQSSPEATLD